MSLSEAKKRANKKWNDANLKERYDRIQLVTPKGKKEIIQSAAKDKGMSVNEFVNDLIDKALQNNADSYGISDTSDVTD